MVKILHGIIFVISRSVSVKLNINCMLYYYKQSVTLKHYLISSVIFILKGFAYKRVRYSFTSLSFWMKCHSF